MNALIARLRLQGFDVVFENDTCVLRRYTGTDTDVYIPEEIDVIGDCAFFDKPVHDVFFGENITQIGSGAFEKCTELSYISPMIKVKKIDSYAFAYTIKLKKAEFSDSLIHIGECAFNGSALERISIPASVRDVGYKAFFACHKLVEVIADGDDAIYGESCFANCRNLRSADVKAGVSQLERRAFSYCKNLGRITINASTGVGEDAFEAVSPCSIVLND